MKVGGVVGWKGKERKGKHSRHVASLLDASRLFPPKRNIGTSTMSTGSFPRSNQPAITIVNIDSWSLCVCYGIGELPTSLDQFFVTILCAKLFTMDSAGGATILM